MYRNQDFLEVKLPPNADDLMKDLELKTLLDTMSRGDEFLLDVLNKAILSSLDNPEAIARFGNVPVLGKVMHFDPDSKAEEIWRDFEKSMTGLPDILDALGCDTNESA